MAKKMLLSRVILAVLSALWVVSAHAERAPYGMSFPAVQSLPADAPDWVASYGDAPSQHAEFWSPAAAGNSSRPLVVLVHGGCWLDAYGVDHVRALATAIRREGYPVLAPEYRRVGTDGGGWPQSRDDLMEALDLDAFPESRVNDLPDKLILIGHSAGGHLALMVAAALVDAGQAGRLQGVIGLAAITDPAQYARGSGSCNQAAAEFFGGTPNDLPERYAEGSPLIAWAGAQGSVPTVLIQGTNDSIVPSAQAAALASAPAVVLNELLGAGHFDLIHPQTPAFDMLLRSIRGFASAAE